MPPEAANVARDVAGRYCLRLYSDAMRSRPASPLPWVVLLLLLTRSPLVGQEDGVRVGISFGSTSLISAVLEFVDGGRSLEVDVGTWSFRDLSVSVVGKGYLGASHLRPVLGGGLWAMLARPVDAPRRGMAILARFPVGLDWKAGGEHFIDFEMSVTKGLYVRRPNPDNDSPINPRLVPLPGLSWRWRP